MSHFVLFIFVLTAFVAYRSFLILEFLASMHQNYITKKGAYSASFFCRSMSSLSLITASSLVMLCFLL